MTKIIKIADNHYRYGDIDMEITADGTCEECPIFLKCRFATYCSNLIGQNKHFKLKENKMESKIFVIDNGDKQGMFKLWKEERNVCFQVLVSEANLKSTSNVTANEVDTYICSERLAANSVNDFKIGTKFFNTNEGRDVYFNKACGWLQEFVDINSKPDSKFDVYDVEFNSISMAFNLDGCDHSASSAINWDNFAGIEYKGFAHEWKLCRVVISAGCLVSETEITDENITQAIPARIRFFKDTK